MSTMNVKLGPALKICAKIKSLTEENSAYANWMPWRTVINLLWQQKVTSNISAAYYLLTVLMKTGKSIWFCLDMKSLIDYREKCAISAEEVYFQEHYGIILACWFSCIRVLKLKLVFSQVLFAIDALKCAGEEPSWLLIGYHSRMLILMQAFLVTEFYNSNNTSFVCSHLCLKFSLPPYLSRHLFIFIFIYLCKYFS